MDSPYLGLPIELWSEKTLQLIDEHPINIDELYQIVVTTWHEIFESKFGSKPFQIGADLFPRPQIMGYFLHELIPLNLEYRYPTEWRREQTSNEKDLVYIPDSFYSIEIKTSSSKKNIYGNRSYAQLTTSGKKSKSGYYLAVNFQPFSTKGIEPSITLVRFGWLDHEDWQGQSAASGQQARLKPEVEQFKLLALPLGK